MSDSNESASTVVIFHSISGSAGKSFLSGTLFKHWRKADAEEAPRTLLIDADLVGGTLSRMAFGGEFEGVTGRLREEELFATKLMEQDVELPDDLEFLAAARWLKLAHIKEQPFPVDTGTKERLRQGLEQVDAERSLPESLAQAQDAQARLSRDHGAQRRFWANLFRDAARRPRRIIVDLPAQGPAGVSLTSHWSRVQADARETVLRARKAPPLRLVRVLVFATERHGGRYASEVSGSAKNAKGFPLHALIQEAIDGVEKNTKAFRDVVVVENFSDRAPGTGKSPRLIPVMLVQRRPMSTDDTTKFDFSTTPSPITFLAERLPEQQTGETQSSETIASQLEQAICSVRPFEP